MGYSYNPKGDGAGGAVGAFAFNSEVSNCIFDSNWVKSDAAAFGGALQIGLNMSDLMEKFKIVFLKITMHFQKVVCLMEVQVVFEMVWNILIAFLLITLQIRAVH